MRTLDNDDRSASLASAAAGRLNAVATIILVILSLVAMAGAAFGVALIRADTGSDRVNGVTLIVGSVLAWLSGALTCFACQAIARYIEFRTDEA